MIWSLAQALAASPKGIRPVRIIAQGLQRIVLPPLTRPLVKPTEEPTEALVDWGVRYYVYSLVAHVRFILEGIVQVSDAGNVSAAFVLGRHVFEWAAHACFVTEKLHQHYQKNLWREAWQLQSAVATGSLWIKRYGAKYADPGAKVTFLDDTPNPIHIREAVSAYDKYLKQNGRALDGVDTYSFLSEHSHPNAACLLPYHQYQGRDVHFDDPDPRSSPLPAVTWCLIDILGFLRQLLVMSHEASVHRGVVAVLREVANLMPKKGNSK